MIMSFAFSCSAAARRPRLSLAASLATFSVAFGLSLFSQGSPIAGTHIIAISDDPAPDGNGTFREFKRPRLNEAGQVAFFSDLIIGTRGGLDDDTGIFRGEPGVPLTQIAREGLAGTFTPGWSDLSLYPVIDDSGQVAFTATYQPSLIFGGAARRGEFRGSGGSVTHIALEGNPVPGGGTFSSWFGPPQINEAGQVAFRADIDTGAGYDDAAVFRGTGGPVTLIAREGQAAPDGNGTLSWLWSDFPALNKSGQVAFSANLQGTSGGTTDNRAIFRGNGGALTQIARAGQTAPDGNGVFSGYNFSYTSLNNTGQAAFGLDLTGTSGGTKDDSGIFLGDGGPITQVAREGDITPDGTGYLGPFGTPSLNNAGEVAFTAEITGTKGGLRDGSGIFRGAGRRLTQIARTGQSAPDGNGTFSYFEFWAGEMNDKGQLAFRAYLTGTSGGTSDDLGLFFFDGVGLQQIARAGQSLGGSIINGLGLNNDCINELGQVAYRAHLIDGKEAVVLWTPPVLPGDYDLDGVVNAADYAVWRKNDGTTNMLPNDPIGGTIGQAQYNLWSANFGATAGPGAGSGLARSATVPEPTTMLMLLTAVTVAALPRRRTA
jgi:hypothetical protein